mmetsp:Transcript_76539/g.205345  ORF Transcript_76539/g.205345 Transcript_76539/m.205345 type:complete len:212 (+) Transcript_76539:532-1167(+)
MARFSESSVAQLGGGSGMSLPAMAGPSWSSSKRLPNPGQPRYHSTRRAASACAGACASRQAPANLWTTPRTSISTVARQLPPSQLTLHRGLAAGPPHTGMRPQKSSKTLHSSGAPSPARPAPPRGGPEAGSAAARAGSSASRASAQAVTKKPRARSAASRWASFLDACHAPAAWCGTPSSAKATRARNSSLVLWTIRWSKLHCRIWRWGAT